MSDMETLYYERHIRTFPEQFSGVSTKLTQLQHRRTALWESDSRTAGDRNTERRRSERHAVPLHADLHRVPRLRRALDISETPHLFIYS